MTTALTVHLAPIIPEPFLWGLAAAALALTVLSFFFYRRGVLWRPLCAALFLMVFANPSLVNEDRRPVTDVAAVVVDRSPSQNNGERTKRADAALAALKNRLENQPGLEVRFVEAPQGEEALAQKTELFSALEQVMGDVPPQRRAGVVMITDGQVHDAPADAAALAGYGPVHALITGERNERDRQIVIVEGPAYGIVGQTVTIRYRIEDSGSGSSAGTTAAVTHSVNNENPQSAVVATGDEQSLTVAIQHAGQNVVELSVSELEGETTLANNRVPLIINGVRDRLRVLLVSGQPHAGGRTWRDLLTADPGVDLVHFTILREPNKLDATPQHELSLIAFPFRELFELKLYDFDLIIFDRYRLNRILPNFYFANIAKYVREGGALLEASGPSFATEDSVYTTALKEVLPAYPTGQVIERSFRPQVTDIGRRHPVTMALTGQGADAGAPSWGPWLRQVAVSPTTGSVVMTGADSLPLLILSRTGEGRVAQLASDQIWLWSRGFEGGGPQAELLRRLAHWLMKEPELEENALELSVNGRTVTVTRRATEDIPLSAILTTPQGKDETLELKPAGNGTLEAVFEATDLGIYSVDDGTQKRFAVIGELNPPELRGVVATADILRPFTDATEGGVFWLQDFSAAPEARLQPAGRDFHGGTWLGLRKNGSFTVAGVKDSPLLPSWLYAAALMLMLLAAWWLEGRARKI